MATHAEDELAVDLSDLPIDLRQLGLIPPKPVAVVVPTPVAGAQCHRLSLLQELDPEEVEQLAPEFPVAAGEASDPAQPATQSTQATTERRRVSIWEPEGVTTKDPPATDRRQSVASASSYDTTLGDRRSSTVGERRGSTARRGSTTMSERRMSATPCGTFTKRRGSESHLQVGPGILEEVDQFDPRNARRSIRKQDFCAATGLDERKFPPCRDIEPFTQREEPGSYCGYECCYLASCILCVPALACWLMPLMCFKCNRKTVVECTEGLDWICMMLDEVGLPWVRQRYSTTYDDLYVMTSQGIFGVRATFRLPYRPSTLCCFRFDPTHHVVSV
eukprot:EG_transcript_10296